MPGRPVAKLWIPSTAERAVIGHCRVCGTDFYEGEFEAAQRHMGACARANMDVVRAQDERLELFKTNPDPEIEQHMLAVGRRMVREGRMVVKPNEKAGF